MHTPLFLWLVSADGHGRNPGSGQRGDRMEEQRHYSAFISYRHLKSDQAVAEQVQNLLESYRPPKGIAEGKRIGRIFRDTTELPASRDLDGALTQALEMTLEHVRRSGGTIHPRTEETLHWLRSEDNTR